VDKGAFFLLLAVAIVSITSTNARAANICQGQAPAPGEVVHGPVLQVADGSSLCLGVGGSPEAWVMIRVPQLGASRQALMAVAFGKNATCVIGRNGQGDCMIEGQPLASALRAPEIIKAVSEWR